MPWTGNIPDILYVPEDARFDLHAQRISWSSGGTERAIKLLPDKTYVRPSGYKVRMEKPAANRGWRLVGTVAEGLLCHKPCTVSGGGKSEISKPITDAILVRPVFVADFKKDFDRVAELIGRDYGGRFLDPARADARAVLSAERSLGSVIKLLTPDEHDYQPEYNAWLESVPQYLKELVFVVKRYYKPEWGGELARPFQRGHHQRQAGNELKCDNRRLVTTYLRVGFDADGSWRTFGLRKDFNPAMKIQAEDDITASVVVPADRLRGNAQRRNRAQGVAAPGRSSSFTTPNAASFSGRTMPSTAATTSRPKRKLPARTISFPITNPFPPTAARELIEDSIGFYQFTEPMQAFIREVSADGGAGYFVCSAQSAPRGRQADQKPALPANAPRPGGSARTAPRRNVRPLAPPAAPDNRC